MTKLRVRKLYRMGNTWGLFIAGLVSLAVPVRGQLLHPDDPMPSYEVATIKPAGPGQLPLGGARDVARFSGTMRMYIQQAFQVPPGSEGRVLGGPSWVDSDRYVIEGKYPAEYVAKISTLPLAQRLVQTGLMQQSLLAERFKLKMHFEMREMPIYELVVAKGGPKLTPAKDPPAVPGTSASPDAASAPRPPAPGPAGMDPASMRQGIVIFPSGDGMKLTAKGMTLDSMIQMPRFTRDRPIVNKTGLTGRYDFTLEWSTPQAAVPGDNGTPPAGDAPTMFTAFEEQLGLKLVPAKGLVEVVVIDSIERPTEN